MHVDGLSTMCVMSRSSDTSNMQFSLRALFIGMATVLACYVAIEQMIGHAVPRNLLRQVKPGMTEQEVCEILGPPQRRSDDSFQYGRFANPGYVQINFEDGRLSSINDESVFP